jgi:AraC-like DNA-binding protein
VIGTISQFAGVYREWLPDPALREHIRCVWVNPLIGTQEKWVRVVPDGCVDIVWTGEELCVAGPDTRAVFSLLPPDAPVAGIRFHPGAASLWLGLPLDELLNRRVPLTEFWKDESARFFEGFSTESDATAIANRVEALLFSRLARVGPADGRIAFLRRAAGDNCAPASVGVDEIAAYVGLSERTMRRRCTDAFGYGFKTLDRILRFQRFFHLASHSAESSLAVLAARAGYADQAHLTREVQRMSGLTAGEFAGQIAVGLADSFKTRRTAAASFMA